MDTVYEIQYNNFQPSDDIKKLIYKNVDKILMKAPSDAFLRVSVAVHREMYKIDFKLSSRMKTIQKDVIGKNLLQSINELQDAVFQSLHDWKKTRNLANDALA